MRLPAAERQAVARAAAATLPKGSEVLLFGSRLDDGARGGDLDLLLELPAELDAAARVELRSRFVARIYRQIDERRIDIVMASRGREDPRAIVRLARHEGVRLVSV